MKVLFFSMIFSFIFSVSHLAFAILPNPPATPNPSPRPTQTPVQHPRNDKVDKGDVDMTQFNNLKKTPEKSNVKVNYSCQDLNGRIFKKDEPGFNKCLEDSQTALMNKNKPVEAPSGERTH